MANEITNDSLSLYRCVHCECVTILSIGNPQAGCKCGAEFYPMSRAVTEGEPMTLAQIAGEALEGLTLPDAQASRIPNPDRNWTLNGKVESGSGDEYEGACEAVEKLIRNSAGDLIAGRADSVARLIVSQLAPELRKYRGGQSEGESNV